jgi:pimeloyl-ACP methyl ester carboxylesterase
MRALFWYAALPESVPVSEGIQLYRISYWSRIDDGKPALLSGLLALPTEGDLRGTVLYMHGTHTSREDSVSNPAQEGVLVAGAFAGGGYLLVAPDLSGQGISPAPQPYFVNSITIEQTLDFLRAVRTVSRDLGHPWNANLYVLGFSQGGNNTAVVQRELERRHDPAWHVRASAGIAGPYNMADIALPLAMTGVAVSDSTYLTNLALSYSAHYHHPLESVMKPDMAARARILFDGDHTVDDTTIGMPRKPRELFTQEFLEAFDNRKPNWFIAAMRENEAYAWAPSAPFRAYYGDKDVDVDPRNAEFFVRETTRRGGHAQAVDVGPQDHTGTVFHAVPMIRRWFDALSGDTAVTH